MSSETGIEGEVGYTPTRTERRIEAGVGLLWWVVVYAVCVAAVLMDVLVWRPN